MTDIILSTQNGEPVASSRQIAESFGKEQIYFVNLFLKGRDPAGRLREGGQHQRKEVEA